VSRNRKPLDISSFTLLPCPFCGGKADIELIENGIETRKVAGCNTKFCQGYQSAHAFATYKEAAAAWNRRAK
jgi:hypothetical protein